MRHFKNLATFFDHPIKTDLSNLYIIGVQHLLDTTGSLVEKFISMGVPAQNIYLLGKIYSTNSDVKRKLKVLGATISDSYYYQKPGFFSEVLNVDVQFLWNKLWQNLKKEAQIIVLDDGGFVLKNTPQEIINSKIPIVGIEQTTSGIWQLDKIDYPIVNVAQSAVKKLIEPPLISKALHHKIKEILSKSSPKSIGVVGYGNIGKSIVNEFCRDYKIHLFDLENNKIEPSPNYIIHNSIETLFLESRVIIGATGRDISDLSWLSIANEDKLLISVSSSDREFNTLLKHFSNINDFHYPLSSITLECKTSHTLTLYRGGTVANFDGSPHSVPLEEIQLTRGLLYAAFLQALELLAKDEKKIVPLCGEFQQKVLDLWFENHPEFESYYNRELLEQFDSISWIDRFS